MKFHSTIHNSKNENLSEDLEIKIGNTYKKQRIKEIEYNDLGQIKSVKRGQLLAQSEDNMNPYQPSSTGIDAVNYAYNVNGWLNRANYPNGVCFDFTITDAAAIKSTKWSWNKTDYKKNASGYNVLD